MRSTALPNWRQPSAVHHCLCSLLYCSFLLGKPWVFHTQQNDPGCSWWSVFARLLLHEHLCLGRGRNRIQVVGLGRRQNHCSKRCCEFVGWKCSLCHGVSLETKAEFQTSDVSELCVGLRELLNEQKWVLPTSHPPVWLDWVWMWIYSVLHVNTVFRVTLYILCYVGTGDTLPGCGNGSSLTFPHAELRKLMGGCT